MTLPGPKRGGQIFSRLTTYHGLNKADFDKGDFDHALCLYYNLLLFFRLDVVGIYFVMFSEVMLSLVKVIVQFIEILFVVIHNKNYPLSC